MASESAASVRSRSDSKTQARLSGLDTVFLAAERPGAALHTMAILVLDPSTIPEGYEFERFRANVARRVTSGPLTHRLVAAPLPWQRPRWRRVERLQIDQHIVRSALPPPGDARQLAQLTAWIDEQPLDRNRPLWVMHVVEGLDDGSIALVCKLSHALMDGIAGMEFMASFFTADPDERDEHDDVESLDRSDDSESEEDERGVSGLARDVARDVRDFPVLVARTVRGLGAATLHATRSVGARGLRPPLIRAPAPRVPWNNALTPSRSVAFTEVDLDDLRDAARRHDATINDVLLAIVSGALREHLIDADELPERPLVAAVPVSVHDEEHAATNAVSVMLVRVASDLTDPAERLAATHQATSEAKRAHDERGPALLMTVADLVPTRLIQLGAAFLVDVVGPQRLPPICNFMLSNVAGPPVPLYVAGARLRELFPLGPIFPGMGLNVTAVSRERKVGIGLVTCPAVLGDVWAIADSLPKHLDELRVAT